jgi:hypothetical protein
MRAEVNEGATEDGYLQQRGATILLPGSNCFAGGTGPHTANENQGYLVQPGKRELSAVTIAIRSRKNTEKVATT